MKFRMMSDLHLECTEGRWQPSILPDDKDTVLLLAGDIWNGDKIFSYCAGTRNEIFWMKQMSERFKAVVLVSGNHCYWGMNFTYSRDKLIELCNQYPNVYYLEDDYVLLDDVLIVGSCLWTDFNRADPIAMYDATRVMNDYRYIKIGNDYRRVKPNDILSIHIKSRKYIESVLRSDLRKQARKTIVMSHHGPTYQNRDERYTSNNEYYFSNTQMVVNPRGYHTDTYHEDTGFDENLILEV